MLWYGWKGEFWTQDFAFAMSILSLSNNSPALLQGVKFPSRKTVMTPLVLAEGEEVHENDTTINDVTYQFPPPTRGFPWTLKPFLKLDIEGNSYNCFPGETETIVYPLFTGHHQQTKVQLNTKPICGLGLLMEHGGGVIFSSKVIPKLLLNPKVSPWHGWQLFHSCTDEVVPLVNLWAATCSASRPQSHL